MKTARDVMTRDVYVAEADWTTDELADFFLAHRISGAPVADGHGKLVGVVSSTDLLQDRGARAEIDAHAVYGSGLEHSLATEELLRLEVRQASQTTVRELMTPLVFEISADAPVSEVADTLLRGRIHRVFVTEGAEIVGVVSAFDLLTVVRELGDAPGASRAGAEDHQ
ncbi:MAG: CBS domain-containing protein [Polyangiaceae bacterium]|nr:CBS domain-containing protein [Polyangiaceae bacterium]